MSYVKAMKHYNNPRKWKMTAMRRRGNQLIFGAPATEATQTRKGDWMMTTEYHEGDKVIFQGRVYDFGYYTAGRYDAVLYEEGERSMQDSIAVKLSGVSRASIAATQPAPDTGERHEHEPSYGGFADDTDMIHNHKEWHVERDGLGDAVFDEAGIAVALGCGLDREQRARRAAQIVSDHNAVPRLVEALQTARTVVFAAGGKQGTWNRELAIIDDALALTTLRKGA